MDNLPNPSSVIFESVSNNDKPYFIKGIQEIEHTSYNHFLDAWSNQSDPYIYFCAYHIRHDEGRKPFLQYMMLKNNQEGTFSFPSFQCKREKGEDIRMMIDRIAESYLTAYHCLHKCSLVWKGFQEDNGDFYLFFDASEMNVGPDELSQ